MSRQANPISFAPYLDPTRWATFVDAVTGLVIASTFQADERLVHFVDALLQWVIPIAHG